MNPQNKVLKILIPLSFIFFLILNVISWKFPFFWDTILTSTICSWYYDHGFGNLIYPSEFDAGHPPLFYIYIVGWWRLMENSLLVSHFAMLPILWIMVYQFLKLADVFIQEKIALVFVALLFLLEPAILTQSTLVSYDIVMVCMFFLAIRMMYLNKYFLQFIALLCLSLISIRGSIAVFSILLIEFSLKYILWNEKDFSYLLKYALCFILTLLWYHYHFHQTGWYLFTPSSQWEGQRSTVDAMRLLRNIAVVGRNLLDHGRIVFFALLIPSIFILLFRNRFKPTNRLLELIAITFIPLEVFIIAFIPFSNPIGHRYFMIPIACSILLFGYCVQEIKWIKRLAVLPLAAFIAGHFIIYPVPISNGWDVTLMHTRYFKLYKDLHRYLGKEVIPLKDVASKFPLSASRKQTHLGENSIRMKDFNLTNADYQYAIFSNISNDFSNEEIEALNQWEEIERFESGPVFIQILAVPEIN